MRILVAAMLVGFSSLASIKSAVACEHLISGNCAYGDRACQNAAMRRYRTCAQARSEREKAKMRAWSKGIGKTTPRSGKSNDGRVRRQ